jgi:hypothetical protein
VPQEFYSILVNRRVTRSRGTHGIKFGKHCVKFKPAQTSLPIWYEVREEEKEEKSETLH